MAGDTIKFLIEMRDGASKPLKKVGKAAEDAAEDAKGATIKYTELASKLTLLGMAAKGATKIVGAFAKPLLAIAQGGIAAGAQMEGFETRLNVLMGSSSAAKERLDELFEIGSTTPFELPGLMEAEVNLRALGVNAEKTLPMVMDFAGAMGVDLASAAVEVGRAMQFGAGAVETISGRALRAQVELRTGADALKMSTEEFREAMVETLTDPDGIFKGGTEKLAATFEGMLSNLQDAFFKFQKEVGDAGLFLTAKATLATVLELLDKNQTETKNFATLVSGQLVEAFFALIRALAGLIRLSINWAVGLKSVKLVLGTIGVVFLSIAETVHSIITALRTFRALMPTESVGQALALDKAAEESKESLINMRQSVLSLKLSNAETHQEIVELQKQYDKLGDGATALIDGIIQKTEELKQANKDAAEGPIVRKPDAPELPTPPPTETEAGKDKEATPTAEELEAIFLGLEAPFKELQKVIRDNLSPAALATGFTKGIQTPFASLTAMMGPAGGLFGALSSLGQQGADNIVKGFKDSIKGVVVALVEVLPALIVEIPKTLIDSFPMLIEGFVMAIPALAKAILIELPTAIAKGLVRWFRNALLAIEKIFFPDPERRRERRERRQERKEKRSQRRDIREESQMGFLRGEVGLGEVIRRFFRPLGKKHTGTAHIDRTGAFLLQAGEAVVPNSGTTTQGMERRMSGRGGGGSMNVTINTNVVDKNAIRGLGKLLEKEFGSMGRSTSPVFNSPTGARG